MRTAQEHDYHQDNEVTSIFLDFVDSNAEEFLNLNSILHDE